MNQSDDIEATRRGRFWHFADGTILPFVSGGSDDGDGGDGGDDGKIKFTQEELNRVASKEKKDGKKAGRSEILSELGLEDEGQLKDIVTQYQEQRDRNRSDLEKAQNETAAERTKREAAEARADNLELGNRVADLLSEAGMGLKAARKSVRLIDANKEMSDHDIEELIKELKADMPGMFGESNNEDDEGSEGKPKPPKSSDPGRPPKPKSDDKSSATDRARDRLSQRHPDKIRQGT